MKYIGTLNPIINIIAAIVLSISYVYSTFATKVDVKDYVDQRHESAMTILIDIKDRVHSIDKKVWELSKERGK